MQPELMHELLATILKEELDCVNPAPGDRLGVEIACDSLEYVSVVSRLEDATGKNPGNLAGKTITEILEALA